MPTSSRLYFCCRCHAQVIICSRCDRGQRYCPGKCRQDARSESLKRAGKKYQSSRAGRFNNAARQQRFRQRNQQKVTHHGSVKKPLHDLLKTCLAEIKKPREWPLSGVTCHCHYCGAVCGPFLRLGFMRSSGFNPLSDEPGLFSPFNHPAEAP